MTRPFTFPPIALLSPALFAVAGCPGGAPDGGVITDGGDGDGDADGDGDSDSDSDGDGDGGVLDEHGFTIRTPQSHEVPCDGLACGGDGTISQSDVDMLCTLTWGEQDAVVYVQSRPTAYLDFAGFDYATDGAWLSEGGMVSTIDATYDWGGNHHNDALTVTTETNTFRWYHASFGFGFRACQPPNCLQVYSAAGSTLIEDGCGAERSLPEVCVVVKDDGTYPPLVDTFELCPGDPNADH